MKRDKKIIRIKLESESGCMKSQQWLRSKEPTKKKNGWCSEREKRMKMKINATQDKPPHFSRKAIWMLLFRTLLPWTVDSIQLNWLIFKLCVLLTVCACIDAMIWWLWWVVASLNSDVVPYLNGKTKSIQNLEYSVLNAMDQVVQV